MRASSLSFRAAVLFVIAGMVWGLYMAISENHVTFPAHAHLNLLGWVSLFLFGLFYHLHPGIDRSRAALVQVWIWMAGVVIQTFGVGRVYTGHPSGEAFAAAGSFIVLGAMILFAWLVYRREHYAAAQELAASPAK
jgi:FtsH-binding integral membrane protein